MDKNTSQEKFEKNYPCGAIVEAGKVCDHIEKKYLIKEVNEILYTSYTK